MNLEKLVRKNILELSPYSSARDEFSGDRMVQLDANENPHETGFNRYPDPYQNELKAKLSDIKGVAMQNIFLGNGSDEIIDIAIRTFCEPGVDNILTVKPSYGMYRVSAKINNVELKEVALNQDFSLNAELILKAVDDQTKVIILCSPNNPTGNSFEVKSIKQILDAFDGPVLIDEAYVDFSSNKSWSNELSNFSQLIVIQTLSKYYGMADLRLGIAYASPEIIRIFNKVKPPYNIAGQTQRTVLKQLEQNENRINLEFFETEKKRLENYLNDSILVEKVYPSDANFLLVKFYEARKVFDYLKENGLIVRDRSKEFNCENCLRISIGTANENLKLMKTLSLLS